MRVIRVTGGEIALKYDPRTGSFSAWYFDHRFPINPQRYADILKTAVAAADAADQLAGQALLSLASGYARPGQPSYAAASTVKQRLAAYSLQARFALASIYDKAATSGNATGEGGVDKGGAQ